VFDEAYEPFVAQRVKERPDVAIQNVIHLCTDQTKGKRIQCLMWTAPGSEPVRESQEILLVDRIEHFHHGTLDNFVFQRGYT
jgi:hypothetical protein